MPGMSTSATAHQTRPRLAEVSALSRFTASALVFAIAFLATSVLHEFGHGLVSFLFGQHPVVYVSHVENPEPSTTQTVLVALAGPVTSLITGLIILALPRGGPAELRLLRIWAGTLGVQNFFGYLLTGPFVQGGDIGKVWKELGVPIAVQLAFCVVGAVVGTVGLGWLLAAELTRLASDRTAVVAMGIFGWIGGTVLVLLANIPWYNAFVAVYLVCGGVFSVYSMPFLRRAQARIAANPPRRWANSAALAAVAAVVVAVVQLVLRHGVVL